MCPDIDLAVDKKSPKVGHRGWFSEEEYKQLCAATRDRARNRPAPGANAAGRRNFTTSCCSWSIRACVPTKPSIFNVEEWAIVTDAPTGERILDLEVRGKTGIGNAKSMPGAVLPFKRLCQRRKLKPEEGLFTAGVFTRFNALLGELSLKTDRDGNRRSAYSLRHSYISFRLANGANIYEIAKNCRTSVKMIEDHYAVHLKNRISTEGTNRRSPAPKKKARRGRTRRAVERRSSAAECRDQQRQRG